MGQNMLEFNFLDFGKSQVIDNSNIEYLNGDFNFHLLNLRFICTRSRWHK